MKILANDGLNKIVLDYLNKNNHEVLITHYDTEQLMEKLGDFDILIMRTATTIRKPLIDKVKNTNLKLIIRAGVGLDNIDVDYAMDNGIMVTNTPNSSANAVSELVLGHMFTIARDIQMSNITMRQGQWNKRNGIELFGKTLGIIGMGRIGTALGKKARLLGMNVIFYDKYKTWVGDFKYVDQDELLRRADIISIHTPSTPEPIINEETINKMKDNVIIINAARGTVMDEKALLAGLKSGKIYGAGIDVFMDEPHPNLELLNHERISITPHIGGSTVEAQARIAYEIVGILENFTSNQLEIAI